MNNDDINETTPTESVVNLDANIQIETTEDKYKTDGSVILGYRNPDNTYTVTNNNIPDKIDIDLRKQEQKAMQNAKKKNAQVSKNITKEAKRVQNIVAIVVLVLFVGVGGFFYYVKYFANNKNFTLKKVHVEYGSPFSLKIADYINLSNPDEKQFALDLTEFVPDRLGEYKYKIRYQGVTKEGIIEVSDTTPPDVTLQEVKLNVGSTYTPEMFIKECKDYSSCIYTFEDGSAIKTATEVGRTTVYLNIKDKEGNQITKQGTLNVKSTDLLLNCEKDFGFDYNAGYKNIKTYSVRFNRDNVYQNTLLKDSKVYIDNNDYIDFKDKNQSDEYSYDDRLSKVTKTSEYTTGFGVSNTMTDIRQYLESDGYTCSVRNDTE